MDTANLEEFHRAKARGISYLEQENYFQAVKLLSIANRLHHDHQTQTLLEEARERLRTSPAVPSRASQTDNHGHSTPAENRNNSFNSASRTETQTRQTQPTPPTTAPPSPPSFPTDESTLTNFFKKVYIFADREIKKRIHPSFYDKLSLVLVLIVIFGTYRLVFRESPLPGITKLFIWQPSSNVTIFSPGLIWILLPLVQMLFRSGQRVARRNGQGV